MTTTLAYLFFAPEQQMEAELLRRDLEIAGCAVLQNPSAAVLEQMLKQAPKTPVMVLVSDNLLKSLDLMGNLQIFVDQLPENFFPILTDSLVPDEQGHLQRLATRIETIPEQGYYRDFWYDERIRLNRLGEFSDPAEQMLHEQQQQVAKRMSMYISVFLRGINQAPAHSLEAFRANHYQVFFAALGRGEQANYERFPLQPEEEFKQPLIQEPKQPELKDEQAHTPEIQTPLEPTEIPLEHKPPTEQPQLVLEKEEEPEAEKQAEIETPIPPIKAEEPAIEVEEPFTLSLDRLPSHIAPEDLYEHFDIEQVEDLDVLFYIAEAEMEQGSYANAKHGYERILALDPSNGRALLWLARLLSRHIPDQVLAADMYYKKALLFNEEQAGLYYEYAQLIQKHFQAFRRAVDLLHQALELDPQYAEAYLLLSRCQLALGLLDSAKAQYLQAVLLLPELRHAGLEEQLGILRPATVEAPTQPDAEALALLKPVNPNAHKTVLVTGASSGIGQAIAERFAIEGYKVIAAGRRLDRLQILKAGLEQRFEVNIYCMQVDVQDPRSVEQALSQIPELFADVDILINNAGLAKGLAPIHEGEWSHWETMIDTNLKGLLLLSRALSPRMVAKGSGHIIHIGSVAGKEPYPMGNVYCATKAAVDMLTKTMRLDLYKHGVKVSSVNPGHVETEFALVRLEDQAKAKIYEDFKPLNAQDVADAVYYVASRPEHVNIQDVLLFSKQQGSVRDVNRSGRD